MKQNLKKPKTVYNVRAADSGNQIKNSVKTAILVDGAFYRKRAKHFNGLLTPEARVNELMNFCYSMLNADHHEQRNLYRIFYYDCSPLDKNIYNPLTQRSVNLGKTDEYKWMNDFLEKLRCKRKVALRLGTLNENEIKYSLKYDTFKKLLNGTVSTDELQLSDLELNIEQKGVDMRIGVDISSLAFKKSVDQIILISGDSDFVPAAKQARREGIDFLLAPMEAVIRKDLFEHIDGLINWRPKLP